MKKIMMFLLLFLPTTVFGKDITKESSILVNDKVNNKIVDNNEISYSTIKISDLITIKSDGNIHGLYIQYELKSGKGTINYNNSSINIGENGFLHEYIELNSSTNELEIRFTENTKVAEIYVLDDGELPDFVEIWNKPLDNNSDLLLMSTHSDDEQLFFLGLMPTYVAKGANVQVVYLTNHYDNPRRLHEQLHGLYAVGIRNYPIIGIVPDAYSTSLEGAIKNINAAKLSVDDVVDFQVEMIRRFKPSVIVGHDELGEYSHGQHILNTHTLKIALEKATQTDYHEVSYNTYGSWDTPKTYLHLYKENQIKMDYDTPIEYFNGLTAYEVSKIGYSKHLSQQWTWFTKWINGANNSFKKSTEITKYSPNDFGLYRTTVGEDINKNDMFENITLRKDIVQENETTNKEDSNAIEKNNDIISLPDLIEENLKTIIYIALILTLTLIIIVKNSKHKKR